MDLGASRAISFRRVIFPLIRPGIVATFLFGCTLSFDEWAVKTATRFAAADTDKSGAMTATEFATTAPKRRAPHIRKDCPPTQPAAGEDS